MEMDEFLCEQNIERYRRLASSSTDAAQRRVILELLAEEVAKLKHVQLDGVGGFGKTTH